MLNYDQDYYMRYFAQYYNDKLRPEAGVEECLQWVRARFIGSSWLDVGAGPTTFFWATAVPMNLRSVIIADISDEPLKITRDVVLARAWPQAYREAVALLARDSTHLDKLAHVPLESRVFDAFNNWPTLGKVDSISALGLLGIASDDAQLETFAASAHRSLNPGGVLLGAAWEFSEAYARRLGGRRQRLANIGPVLARWFHSVAMKHVPLKDDEDYVGIVLFSARMLGATAF
ncbi:MAG: class I SAM-dependent methyltransferase [Burkholderiaceae bacterium]